MEVVAMKLPLFVAYGRVDAGANVQGWQLGGELPSLEGFVNDAAEFPHTGFTSIVLLRQRVPVGNVEVTPHRGYARAKNIKGSVQLDQEHIIEGAELMAALAAPRPGQCPAKRQFAPTSASGRWCQGQRGPEVAVGLQ
jgi:hypothetical protein